MLGFLTPILIPVMLLEIAFDGTGESWPMNRVLAAQSTQGDDIPFSRAYFSQSFNTYKREGAHLANAQILVAGSSRVMRIRSRLFEPMAETFYNAGGIVQQSTDLDGLVDLIESGYIRRPGVFVLGVDPWWIKRGQARSTWVNEADDTETVGAHVEAIRRFVLLSWQRGWQNPLTAKNGDIIMGIGLAAWRDGRGFIRDGSRRAGSIAVEEFEKTGEYVDRESPPVITRVHSNIEPFTVPAEVDTGSVRLILENVDDLISTGTEVIVLFQPFSSEVADELTESTVLNDWLEYYYGPFADSLREIGANVRVYKDPSHFGVDDTYMEDGFHPTEVLAGRIVLDALGSASPSSLLHGVDQERLTLLIESAHSPWTFDKP